MGRLIDADRLTEIVEGHVTSMSVCLEMAEHYGMVTMKEKCLADIADAPTVDAVPVVHGKKLSQSPVDPNSMICFKKCVCKCSVCGEYVATDWNYCSNCGAKMDGVEENG